MAKFEEFEPNTDNERGSKVQPNKEIKISKIKIGAEEKRKLIAYSILGIITLGFVFYAVNDFSGEQVETIQELGTPESEAEKYNSKLQAIEQGSKPAAATPNLEDAYKGDSADSEKEKNDEASRKLQEQLNALENEDTQSSIPKKTYTKAENQRVLKNVSSKVNSISRENIDEKSVVADKRRETPNTKSSSSSGFFRNTDTQKSSNIVLKNSSVFYACIHTDQIVKEGSRVKIRLTKTISINNNVYPINTIVYGVAKIHPNRLKIEINKINQSDVNLETFDAEDSNEGIYVQTPNLNALIRKEFKKDALDEKDLEKIPFSKTLKNLFAKKTKEESIELLNNYKLIIKEKHEN